MTLAAGSFGEQQVLGYLVNKVTTTENLVYRLFANNHTPTNSDTNASYTEAAGGGYSTPSALTGASWSISGSGPATASYAQQTYTFIGALTTNPTVYGYYVTGATNTTSEYLAELFSASFTPANNGDNIKLTPQITCT